MPPLRGFRVVLTAIPGAAAPGYSMPSLPGLLATRFSHVRLALLSAAEVLESAPVTQIQRPTGEP